MNDRVFDADIYSVAGRLALELECLLIDTKDLSVVSKWWDSAYDALEQWRSIKDTAPQPVRQEHIGLIEVERGIPMFTGFVKGYKPEISYGMLPIYTAPQPVSQEPDYFGLTHDHTWLSISKKQYDRLKPEGRMACYTTPVRTKDLTDDEIMKINVDTASIVPTCDRQFHFARAVIAADREKNK